MKNIFLLVLLVACSKPQKWSKEKLLSMGLKKDASVSLVLPSKMTEGITCAEYGEGCVGAHIVSVQNIEMIAIEFVDEPAAMAAAKKFRGYYSRNWLFDDVTGEPILERFVTGALEAKKPEEHSLEKTEAIKPE